MSNEVKKEEVREMQFEYKDEVYFLREPSGPEIVDCENVKSEIWFSAIKSGVPGEEEILDTLEEQGRFSREKFQQAIQMIDEELSECLIDITQSENEGSAQDAYKRAQKFRKKMLDIDRRRQSYVMHSAEQKSENAYYLAMLGLCCFQKEEVKGKIKNKYILSVINEDVDKVDVSATHKKVTDWDDPGLITTAISNFIPFLRGFKTSEIKMPEDILFENRLEVINRKEITDQSKEADGIDIEDEVVEDDNEEQVVLQSDSDNKKIEENNVVEVKKAEIVSSNPPSFQPSVKSEDIVPEKEEDFYKVVLAQQGGQVERLGDASGKRVLDALPNNK